MTNEKKPWLTPKKGEVDISEKRTLVAEALKKRQSATHQFFWFSMSAAEERWQNPLRGIVSGMFQGVRKFYTNVTFFKEPPPGRSDAKFVGKLKIGEDINLLGNISKEMYEAGIFDARKKTKESFRTTDPLDVLLPQGSGIAPSDETDGVSYPLFEEED